MPDEQKTTVFSSVISNPNMPEAGSLYIDANTFINLFRLEAADLLLRSGRQIVFTEEVREEVLFGDTYNARREWINTYTATGQVVTPTAASEGRPLLSGADAGELSMEASIRSLPYGSDVVAVSDDSQFFFKDFSDIGIPTPVLTGNYFMNSLLVTGAISGSIYLAERIPDDRRFATGRRKGSLQGSRGMGSSRPKGFVDHGRGRCAGARL